MTLETSAYFRFRSSHVLSLLVLGLAMNVWCEEVSETRNASRWEVGQTARDVGQVVGCDGVGQVQSEQNCYVYQKWDPGTGWQRDICEAVRSEMAGYDP